MDAKTVKTCFNRESFILYTYRNFFILHMHGYKRKFASTCTGYLSPELVCRSIRLNLFKRVQTYKFRFLKKTVCL